MKRISNVIGRFVRRWPWLIIIVVVAVTAAAVPGVTMLEINTGYSSFISQDEPIAQANTRYQAEFGGQTIGVLITGKIDDVFSTYNLEILDDFEQFISQETRYMAIYGPISVFSAAWEEINKEQPAGEIPLDDQDFVRSVLYDTGGNVSAAMNPFVPDENHVLINITPVGNMDDEEDLQALVEDLEAFMGNK